MSKEWQLLPGDRVMHFDDLGADFPQGTITRVDPSASFFCYWVQWDEPWRKKLPTGAFPPSAFYFSEMQRNGMTPEMTPERIGRLEALQAERNKRRGGGAFNFRRGD
jgi:hypothetical protein